jgi:hypothetical protein
MSRSGSVLERETMLWLTLFVGLALIGGGIWLIYLDPTGGTAINLFGISIRSTSVGIVGIFCGAVLVGFAFGGSRSFLAALSPR